jgi:hypothetical protein
LANRSSSDSKQKKEAMAAARLHIAQRIARFCSSLSPAEFEQLLDKMVGVYWKYDVLPHLDPMTFDGDVQSHLES